MPIDQVERLGVALAIGLLIGLERGWQARLEQEGERTAGFRTHALASLLGAVLAAISKVLDGSGALTLALGFVAFSAAITVFRYRETDHEGTFGATTVVASMLSFALGAFAMIGDMQIAAGLGVVVAGLLALKAVLHDWLKRISWVELRSVLLLLAMTFILLPLLPNRPVDPWQMLNPFEIWLMTVMIAAISFTGYVAIRLAGERFGIIMTGLAGGLVSSTAVTLTLAGLVRDGKAGLAASVAGALVASATMMARVLVVVAIVQPLLLWRVGLPIGMAGLVLAVVARTYAIQHVAERSGHDALQMQNPFEMATVLKFGCLLTVITALSKVIVTVGGAAGAYMLAALSGIADVDAIVLSVLRLSGAGLPIEVAARAILIVVAVNSVAKAVMAWVVGGASMGRVMLMTAVTAILAGLAGHLLWSG